MKARFDQRSTESEKGMLFIFFVIFRNSSIYKIPKKMELFLSK